MTISPDDITSVVIYQVIGCLGVLLFAILGMVVGLALSHRYPKYGRTLEDITIVSIVLSYGIAYAIVTWYVLE